MAFTTAAIIGLGLSAASTGLSIYGQNQAAKGQQAIYDSNSEAARLVAEQKHLEGRQNVQRALLNKQSVLSRTRAQLASQGTMISSGAALEMAAGTAGRLQLQVLDSYAKADSERSAALQQSEMLKYQSKEIGSASNLQMAGTLLSGLSNLGSSGYSMYRQGSLLTSQKY